MEGGGRREGLSASQSAVPERHTEGSMAADLASVAKALWQPALTVKYTE